MKTILETLKRKWSEYLLEIIVIMVGVFGAFMLNNWNDTRKTKKLEKEILLEIKHSLERDLIDINWNINVHTEMLNSQKIIINWIESNKPYHDSLARHFSIAHRVTQFISTDGPYENLKSRGIRIIQNDSIRNMIMNVYDEGYDFYNELENIYIELIFHTIKFVNNSVFEATINYDLIDPNLYGEMKLLDSIGIRERSEFKYQLKTNLNYNALFINLAMIPTKANIESLIELLQVELDSR